MKIVTKVSLMLILLLYLAVLTKLILFKYLPLTEIINHFNFTYSEYHWRSNNFVPFKTIYFYLFLAEINTNIRIENLVGNIIGFAPFGFILSFLSKRFQKLKTVMIATFCLSLTYEVLQFLFEFGSFDVDDLILNTLGGIVGYLTVKIIQLTMNSKRKAIRTH